MFILGAFLVYLSVMLVMFYLGGHFDTCYKIAMAMLNMAFALIVLFLLISGIIMLFGGIQLS